MMGLSDSEWEELKIMQFELNKRICATMQIDITFIQEELDIHNATMKKIYNKIMQTSDK